jgi:hypothetical protein
MNWFIWLRICPVVGSCGHGNELSVSLMAGKFFTGWAIVSIWRRQNLSSWNYLVALYVKKSHGKVFQLDVKPHRTIEIDRTMFCVNALRTDRQTDVTSGLFVMLKLLLRISGCNSSKPRYSSPPVSGRRWEGPGLPRRAISLARYGPQLVPLVLFSVGSNVAGNNFGASLCICNCCTIVFLVWIADITAFSPQSMFSLDAPGIFTFLTFKNTTLIYSKKNRTVNFRL